MKESLESAIITSNLILQKWREMKPKLMTYTDINGMIVYNIKRIVGVSLNWRELKGLFVSRRLLISISDEGYISKLVIPLNNPEDYSPSTKINTIIGLLNSLDYESLALRAKARSDDKYSEIKDISFDNIESIKF